MTVRYFTGDVTNVDLSEFLSIESSGSYNEMCSTCRKDENLVIIQTILSIIVMTVAAIGMAFFFRMSLDSTTILSIAGTTITSTIWLIAFYFFMPHEKGDHRYIQAWSKLPIIGPKLKANVALSKTAYEKKVKALVDSTKTAKVKL